MKWLLALLLCVSPCLAQAGEVWAPELRPRHCEPIHYEWRRVIVDEYYYYDQCGRLIHRTVIGWRLIRVR